MNDFRKEALDFTTEAFEGITRKFTGEPYINHCIRVADAAEELARSWPGYTHTERGYDEIWVGCLLHDTVEDIEWITLQMIREKFGFHCRQTVDNLTKREGETYLQAILRAKSWMPSRFGKICDNRDNMSDLKEGSLKDKYRLSEYILTH